jgi:hypothetical protein
MSDALTDKHEKLDQELNAALETHSEDELDGLGIRNQRRARIDEYEERAVAHPEPLAALIGMGNADFQRIFEHASTAVLEELDSHPHTVEEIRELAPDIRLLIKLRDSMEWDLEGGSPDGEQPVAAVPAGRKAKGLPGVTGGKSQLLPKRWNSTG